MCRASGISPPTPSPIALSTRPPACRVTKTGESGSTHRVRGAEPARRRDRCPKRGRGQEHDARARAHPLPPGRRGAVARREARAPERRARSAAASAARAEDRPRAARSLARHSAARRSGLAVGAHRGSAGRGVVIIEWRRAHLGCGLLDIAQLATDVSGFSGKAPDAALFGLYGELAGVTVTASLIRAAQVVRASLGRAR